jgi:anti-anti-sigma regulatory factor
LHFQHIPLAAVVAVNVQVPECVIPRAFAPNQETEFAMEVFMTGTMCFEEVMRRVETAKHCELNELVRGCERHLIEEMTPVVRSQSVALDLGSVNRIDAAGIAALISLYRIADEAGHHFSISNVAPHVAELLALVGLDGILISHNASAASHSGPRMVENAA